MNVRSLLSMVCALTLWAGCSSDEAPAAAAPPPPPPPLPGQAAGSAPPANMPEQIKNPLQALQALGALGQQAQAALGGTGQPTDLGPVVNWRDLSAFLPEALGDMKATGEVDGETTTMQGLQVTKVKRSYKGASTRARLEIVDTSVAPFLRLPFGMVQLIQEDSSRGYKRGVQLKGQPAIAEWREKQKDSEVHILAGGRFLVNLDLNHATQGEAERVAESIDIDGIIASAAKAKAQAPAPIPAPAP